MVALGMMALLVVGALALWYRAGSRSAAWRAERTVVCPESGREARIYVLSRPGFSNRADEVLVCSRFPGEPVTCDQRCLKQRC